MPYFQYSFVPLPMLLSPFPIGRLHSLSFLVNVHLSSAIFFNSKFLPPSSSFSVWSLLPPAFLSLSLPQNPSISIFIFLSLFLIWNVSLSPTFWHFSLS